MSLRDVFDRLTVLFPGCVRATWEGSGADDMVLTSVTLSDGLSTIHMGPSDTYKVRGLL